MKIEPDSLGITIQKSRFALPIGFMLACAAIAWYATGMPRSLGNILVSCILGGFFVYLGVTGTIFRKLESHKNYLIHFFALVSRIALIWIGLKVIVPYVHKLI
jgi:hypothetical protein